MKILLLSPWFPYPLDSRCLLADGRLPVTVVPNGVGCEQFHPGLTEPQPDALIFEGKMLS